LHIDYFALIIIIERENNRCNPCDQWIMVPIVRIIVLNIEPNKNDCVVDENAKNKSFQIAL